ncbi:hypothetical protein PR048_000678 [Dryococelus australis]|uniref:Uncharacterized protein n=1 Tax=Dryococelus australis TaxID=614101 RepID=A0ABQ9IFB8_9NEOP|nr:hypothetical protein PR048_000678 [Dryococelus australis]
MGTSSLDPRSMEEVRTDGYTLIHADGRINECTSKHRKRWIPRANRVQASGGSILVWHRFSWVEIGPMVHVPSSLTSERHRNLLADHARHFLREQRPAACLGPEGHSNSILSHTSGMLSRGMRVPWDLLRPIGRLCIGHGSLPVLRAVQDTPYHRHHQDGKGCYTTLGHHRLRWGGGGDGAREIPEKSPGLIPSGNCARIAPGRRASELAPGQARRPSNCCKERRWMLRFGLVVRLLASHLGKLEFDTGAVAPGFTHVGILPDNAAGRRVFSGISRFPRSFIPALHNRGLLTANKTRIRSGIKNFPDQLCLQEELATVFSAGKPIIYRIEKGEAGPRPSITFSTAWFEGASLAAICFAIKFSTAWFEGASLAAICFAIKFSTAWFEGASLAAICFAIKFSTAWFEGASLAAICFAIKFSTAWFEGASLAAICFAIKFSTAWFEGASLAAICFAIKFSTAWFEGASLAAICFAIKFSTAWFEGASLAAICFAIKFSTAWFEGASLAAICFASQDPSRRLKKQILRKLADLWRARNWLLHDNNAPFHGALQLTPWPYFRTHHTRKIFGICELPVLFPDWKIRLEGRRFDTTAGIQRESLWSDGGTQGRGKLEDPDKTRRPAAFPKYEKSGRPAGSSRVPIRRESTLSLTLDVTESSLLSQLRGESAGGRVNDDVHLVLTLALSLAAMLFSMRGGGDEPAGHEHAAALVAGDADVRLPRELAEEGLVAADDPLLEAKLWYSTLCNTQPRIEVTRLGREKPHCKH